MFEIEALQLKESKKCQQILDILECLVFKNDTIQRIKDVFLNEMELALNEKPSSLQMENTYIPELPDGTENGIFLALDLGGTNFRVILIELNAGEIVSETVEHYKIEESLRTGDGEYLFDFLANCVDDFAHKKKLIDEIIYPMGFTFSFPVRQYSLDSGFLLTWTKSFNCPGLVGRDVVQQLHASLRKCNRYNIKVLAIINDTTGTLIQGALVDQQTRIGIVMGTGSNGCYMELADRVRHWKVQQWGEKHVIVDIEWGAFGDNGVLDFIKTEFDRSVDDGSLLRNSFTFEKYIGGKYLGELYRIILLDLYERNLFWPNLPEKKFPKPWTFGSDNISRIEEDIVNGNYTNLIDIIQKHFKCFGMKYTRDDLEIMRYISGIISKRAAQLVAINTSCLLNRMNDETDITIAMDGSVYKHHIRLRSWISYYTNLWAKDKKTKFILVQDGSGKGAALVAAIANKINNRLKPQL